MFDSNDLYSVSGGVKIFNYWNPFVTKHDTSSFYNWEQDNLPLYDLEERTEYLWEKFGYPLSSLPGMAYVVSASVPDIVASANVFTSLSDAIDALPEIIRTPTLIEVAVSGDMGELKLDNIKIVDDGVLEIVNRVFSPISVNQEIDDGISSYISRTANMGWSPYLPLQISGTTSGILGTISSMSAISVSASTTHLAYYDVTSGGDFGKEATPRNFVVAGRSAVADTWAATDYEDLIGYVFAGVGETGSAWVSNTKKWFPKPITQVNGTPAFSTVVDSTMAYLDLSTVREYNGATDVMPEYIDLTLARGMWTNNWLTKIKVQNCDGPIYLRGFIVDGESTTTTGIGVYNSNGITLENCGSMRCTEVGFDINNSKVDLRRQAISARNYDVADRGTLTTYGFKVVDSDVNFVTDSYTSGITATFASQFHDYGLYLENSVLTGGDKIASTALTSAFYTDFAYNDTGIYCSNSKYSVDGVTTACNNVTNIEAKNSTIEVEQLRSALAQSYGMVLDSSEFRYNKNLRSQAIGAMTTLKNQSAPKSHNYPILFNKNGQHLILKGGSTYGPTYPVGASGIDITTLYNQELYYLNHGEVMDDSMKPGVVVDNSVGEFTCSKFIGGEIGDNRDNAVPRHLSVTNNGTAIVRGLTNTAAATNTACYFDGPKSTKATAIIADNNSNVNLTGPVAIYNTGYGAVALNGSKIKASPPLDRNHSFVDGSGYSYDPLTFSGWGGGLYKATPVLEVHCQGAALIADNQSELVLEDLGNALAMWPTAISTDSDYALTSLDYSSLILSGAVQFYPNAPNLLDATAMNTSIGGEGDTVYPGDFKGINVNGALEYTAYLKDSGLSCYSLLYQGAGGYKHNDIVLRADIRAISTGGPAVRVTNNSSAKVQNVHFPMGQQNADQSFYDSSTSPAGCNNYQIWNIEDISQLNASYCVVSGEYPSNAGYTGPRSFYHSGVLENGGAGIENDTSTIQFTLPSGTPDTGSFAVLDHYGSGVQFTNLRDGDLWNKGGDSVSAGTGLSSYMSSIQVSRTQITSQVSYGEVGYQNRGPFRLYFSVNPGAKLLSYVSGGPKLFPTGGEATIVSAQDNIPYQHLAQGYLLSGDCSAPAEFSGMFPEIISENMFEVSGIIATSGYYFPSSMLPPQGPSVWLDESAANTFANAKHCNTSYSNRKRLVNIYKAKTDLYGESFIGNEIDLGYGFRTSNIFDIKRNT